MENKLYSAKIELEQLQSSIPWLDITNTLERWKTGFENQQKTLIEDAKSGKLTNTAYLLNQGDLEGRVRLIEYILMLPDVLIHELENRKNDSRPKQTD